MLSRKPERCDDFVDTRSGLALAVIAAGLVGWLVMRLARATAGDRASGEGLRSIIDSAVDGIVVIDQKGRRVVQSRRGAAVRLSRLRGVGRNVSMLMPSPYHEEHDGYLDRYLATGRRESSAAAVK